MKSAWDSDETPQREKHIIAQILTQAADTSKPMKRVLKKKFGKKLRFRRPDVALGRPFGSVKISDEELMAKLNDFSAETSQMHRTLDRPVRTLTSSKRRCARGLKVGKTQLCQRLRACKLGFSPATTQRGKCDACNAWMKGNRKMLHAHLADGMKKISSIVPDYFTEFLRLHAFEDEWELAAGDCPEYLEEMHRHITGHEA